METDIIIRQQETDATCISIIFPMQRPVSGERDADLLRLEKVLQQTGELLQGIVSPEQQGRLMLALYGLADQVREDFDPELEGIGLYVSPGISRYFRFLFPVKEKLGISDRFGIRELLYQDQYTANYFLLRFNEKGVYGLKGNLNQLKEINDRNLPRQFKDDYLYSKPARFHRTDGYGGIKDFERDKSLMEKERLRRFYNEVVRTLPPYLETGPLVLAAPEGDLALMEGIIHKDRPIAARLKGNYSGKTVKELANLAWPAVKEWIDNRVHLEMLGLVRETAPHLLTDGIRNCWKAIGEGRGSRLIVEKDFGCPAFVDERKGTLHLKPPAGEHHIIPDILEEMMRMILIKGGKVSFVKNGALDDRQHVALVMRY